VTASVGQRASGAVTDILPDGFESRGFVRRREANLRQRRQIIEANELWNFGLRRRSNAERIYWYRSSRVRNCSWRRSDRWPDVWHRLCDGLPHDGDGRRSRDRRLWVCLFEDRLAPAVQIVDAQVAKIFNIGAQLLLCLS
jgi:hypothetical protein